MKKFKFKGVEIWLGILSLIILSVYGLFMILHIDVVEWLSTVGIVLGVAFYLLTVIDLFVNRYNNKFILLSFVILVPLIGSWFLALKRNDFLKQ